jgi:glycosyltransferase involved in cell wall biosynthesis
MAAGLAVVATDIPAIREAMPPESLHYLSPPNDEYGMAENILRLFADRELRNTAGALNRQRVEREYSSQQMCQTMVQVIVNGL